MDLELLRLLAFFGYPLTTRVTRKPGQFFKLLLLYLWLGHIVNGAEFLPSTTAIHLEQVTCQGSFAHLPTTSGNIRFNAGFTSTSPKYLLLMLHLHSPHIYSLQRTCGLLDRSLFRNCLLQEQRRKNGVGCWLNLLYSSLIGVVIPAQWSMDILWFFGIVLIVMWKKIWICPIRQGWHHANGFLKGVSYKCEILRGILLLIDPFCVRRFGNRQFVVYFVHLLLES